MYATKILMASVMLAGLMQIAGCCNPGDTDISPDCPGGRMASATVVLTGELDGIRPENGDKDIQVRGNRQSSDPCIEDGALSAFSVRLQGDAVDTETIAKLAPGAWSINVTALSGGEHPAINQNIVLLAGASSNLVVKATRDGGMVLE